MSGKTFVVRRGMTAIPNATIYGTFEGLADKDGEPGRLSIQSLGLLLLLLSRPNGKASMGYRALLGRGMGRTALLNAKKELRACGLLFEYKRRTAAGNVVTDTVVSETYLDAAEADAEWRAMLAMDGRGTHEPKPDPDPENDGPDDGDDGGSHRVPENGAPGEESGSTVRTITGARSGGASTPRGVAKDSYKSPESGEFQKGGGDELPAHGADGSRNGASGYAAYKATREALAARRPVWEGKNEVASLRPLTEAGRDGSAAVEPEGRLA